MTLLPIHLSVKRGSFRGDHPSPPGSDLLYRKNRASALSRDRYMCRFCGFTHKSNETHHANDDHDDQREENLITSCVLCHMAHHIAFAGVKGRGSIIYLHDVEIDQAGLNNLVRSLWIAEELSKGDTKNTATMILSKLEKAELMAVQVLGTSSAAVLGEFFSSMKEEDYFKRKDILKGVFLLPKKDAYRSQLSVWSKDYKNFNPEEWVKKSKEKFDQWSETV